MIRSFASFVAGFRYLFVLAVLALVVAALGAMTRGIVGIYLLWHGGGALINPAGWLPDVVSSFIQGAFLYFLAVAFCSLFIAEPPVPQWMQVRNLFQLRTKILTFLSFILPLVFLGRIIESRASSDELLFTGGGVFLVLAGIFLLTRYGSPSGDEGMARESGRPLETRSDSGRRDVSRDARSRSERGRKPDKGLAGESRTDQDDWLKKQKEDLKFQKESFEKAVEKDISGENRQRPGGNVTVRPGPKRPRGRR